MESKISWCYNDSRRSFYSQGIKIKQEPVLKTETDTESSHRNETSGSQCESFSQTESFLKQVGQKNENEENQQTDVEHSVRKFAKRRRNFHYNDDIPNQVIKKVRSELFKPTDEVAAGITVGITHPNYPNIEFSNEELKVLQSSVLQEVDKIMEEGPQVRFQNCMRKAGWLQLTCADNTTCKWLEDTIKRIRPWKGAELKIVQGNELPNSYIYVAYIPSGISNVKLTAKQVLKRLKNMNRALNTERWIVDNHKNSYSGQSWTFTVDSLSKFALERLEFKPFFGFGRICFYPKAIKTTKVKVSENKRNKGKLKKKKAIKSKKNSRSTLSTKKVKLSTGNSSEIKRKNPKNRKRVCNNPNSYM